MREKCKKHPITNIKRQASSNKRRFNTYGKKIIIKKEANIFIINKCCCVI